MTLPELKRLEEEAHNRLMTLRAERDKSRSAGAVLAYEDARAAWRVALGRYTRAKQAESKEWLRRRMEAK